MRSDSTRLSPGRAAWSMSAVRPSASCTPARSIDASCRVMMAIICGFASPRVDSQALMRRGESSVRIALPSASSGTGPVPPTALPPLGVADSLTSVMRMPSRRRFMRRLRGLSASLMPLTDLPLLSKPLY